MFYGVQSLLPRRDKNSTVDPATRWFTDESTVERERESKWPLYSLAQTDNTSTIALAPQGVIYHTRKLVSVYQS